MDSALLIPIYIDALLLQSERLVIEATADFSRLPYLDRHLKREINADTANISETIASQPFQSQNLNLKAGVHLHWALPDELTVGTLEQSESRKPEWRFPAVPNRWLVTRRSPNQLSAKSWIVESDYIYPPKNIKNGTVGAVRDRGIESGSISYYYRGVDNTSDQPFRFVGRQLPLDLWLKERRKKESPASYFPFEHPLTAVGYGELSFAAFYPNCRSVFGFHDEELIQDIRGYHYEVIGWYSNPQRDREIKKLLQLNDLENAKWKISGINRDTHPDRLLFYAKLTFDLQANLQAGTGDQAQPDTDVSIAVGTTPMEALSTYLAHQLVKDQNFQVTSNQTVHLLEQFEEQLGLLYLSSELSKAQLDLGSKLREYQHNAGFQAISGGDRWEVRIEMPSHLTQQKSSASPQDGNSSSLSANANATQTQQRLILPAELDQQVKRLNQLQEACNQAEANIVLLRRTLFADWYKYMLSVYQPPDMVRGDDYPDTDRIRYFIHEKDLKPLISSLDTIEQIKQQVEGARDHLKEMIEAYNTSLFAHVSPDQVSPDHVKTALLAFWWKWFYEIQDDQSLKAETRESWNIIFTYNLIVERAVKTNCEVPGFTLNRSVAAQKFPTCLMFDGVRHYVKINWKTPPSAIRQGFTVSAWINPKVSDRQQNLAYIVFSIGSLRLQLQPKFVITIPMLVTLGDRGFSIMELTALAQTIESAKQATDRAAFSTARELLAAIPDKTAFASSEDQSRLLNATARLVLSCPGVDDYITVLTAEQWFHLALVYEAASDVQERSSLKVWVDGRSFPLALNNPTFPGTFDAIYVGAEDQSGTGGFLGQMNHIRVDRRALLDAEIRQDLNDSDRPIYQLQTTAAPRFWQPTEPVILIAGTGIQDTDRHGQDGKFNPDGKLECLMIETIPAALQALWNASSVLNAAQFESEMKALSQRIQAELEKSTSQVIALKRWQRQPWNPLLLEWEVAMQPARGKTNVNGSAFAADMITANYELPDNGVDLSVKPNSYQLADASIYSNSCILTSQVGPQMLEKLGEFLQAFLDQLHAAIETLPQPLRNWLARAQFLQQFYQPQQGGLKLTADRLTALKTWYETKPGFASDAKANDRVYVAICAGLKLFDSNQEPITFLSQSLDGFNEELLMHKQTFQLPVADPLSFEDDQEFTQRVAQAMADSIQSAPEPANQFNPIRSGAMSLTRLRLIDTFGQLKDFNQEAILAAGKEILTPKWLTVPGNPHLIGLPPRLVQPTRIDFRWLPAWEAEPTATPICGWIVPNSLTNSLAIFDDTGKALGAILQRGSTIQWEPAPGRNRQVGEIANPHLRKLVEHLLSKGDAAGNAVATDENFLADLLTAIASALETIDPENYAQHRSLALMMGRPLAIVRARLNLELQGEPAINQGWHAFRMDMERTTRQTDQFTRVRFPVRIGTHQQLNDGVVGYWKETRDGYEYDKFYAPQTPNNRLNRSIDHPDIVIDDQRWIDQSAFATTFGETGMLMWQELLQVGWLKPLGGGSVWARIVALEERLTIPLGVLSPLAPEINALLERQSINPLHILQTIDSPPEYFTLLVDPRGTVHVTTGFLPTKTITLPVEDYAPALENLQVSFLTAPILTEKGTRQLALPNEPGFTWQWLEHKRWLNKAIFAEALQAQNQEAFAEDEIDQLWEKLQEAGWIKPAGSGGRHRLIPMGRRVSEDLPENLITDTSEDRGAAIDHLEDQIEQLFWTDYSYTPVVDRDLFLTRLAQIQKGENQPIELPFQNLPLVQQALWQLLLDRQVGWLKSLPIDPTRAVVVPKDERRMEVLQPVGSHAQTLAQHWFLELQKKIEIILETEAIEISPLELKATFAETQEIREGWLILQRTHQEG